MALVGCLHRATPSGRNNPQRSTNNAAATAAAWGIDACLTAFASDADFPRYLELLRASGVRILRERGLGARRADGTYHNDVRPKFAAEHAAGFQVVAFASPANQPPVQQVPNVLPEDLLAIFEGARVMARDFAGYIDAWEMVGEPDVGYCADLPDRTAAFQKALYLGIRRGAAEALSDGRYPAIASPTNNAQRGSANGTSGPPLVLMGALALPPGPWLQRAVRNGLLEYTDAYNFHFYGHAEDLSGVIDAHARVARRDAARLLDARYPLIGQAAAAQSAENNLSLTSNESRTTNNGAAAAALPLWITECGIDAIRRPGAEDMQRRTLQADFTLATARQALAADRVSVFMPFILQHPHDPFALVLAPGRPMPAWTAYAQFTRERLWPARPAGNPPPNPNPVVLQWLPDNRTTVPHKVSGSYRFRAEAESLELRPGSAGTMAGQSRAQSLESRADAAMLRNENHGAEASEQGTTDHGTTAPRDGGATGRQDAVMGGAPIRGELRIYNFSDAPVSGHMVWTAFAHTVVGFSPPARLDLLPMGCVKIPLSFTAVSDDYFCEQFDAAFVDQSGRMSPVSFVVETAPQPDQFVAEPFPLQPLEPAATAILPGDDEFVNRLGNWTGYNGVRIEQAANGNDATRLAVAIEQRDRDPLRPLVAVAAVAGLPQRGFIRLQLEPGMRAGLALCVDLIDRHGQRFTIWENFGASYFDLKRDDIWLNLADYHPFFWGRCREDPSFHPEDVRSVELSFFAKPGNRVAVKLSVMVSK